MAGLGFSVVSDQSQIWDMGGLMISRNRYPASSVLEGAPLDGDISSHEIAASVHVAEYDNERHARLGSQRIDT